MQAMRGLLLVALVVGCTQVIETAVEPDDFVDVAEAYCRAHPELPCGHVWQCEAASPTPETGWEGHVEVCVPNFIPIESVEAVHGACWPTTRHAGLCWWCCGPGCTAGCNAKTACYCPTP